MLPQRLRRWRREMALKSVANSYDFFKLNHQYLSFGHAAWLPMDYDVSTMPRWMRKRPPFWWQKCAKKPRERMLHKLGWAFFPIWIHVSNKKCVVFGCIDLPGLLDSWSPLSQWQQRQKNQWALWSAHMRMQRPRQQLRIFSCHTLLAFCQAPNRVQHPAFSSIWCLAPLEKIVSSLACLVVIYFRI